MHRAAAEHQVRWHLPVEEARPGHFAAEFRFDGEPDGEWLQLQAAASATFVTAVQVRICIPIPNADEHAGFMAANDASRLGLATVHFEAPAGVLVVQHCAVLAAPTAPGARQVEAGTEDTARQEAMLSMLAAAFITARACLRLVRPEECSAGDLVETFSAFVVARMLRWDVATLVAGSPIHQLLLDATEPRVIVHLDERGLAAGALDPDRSDARTLVEGWLRQGRNLDAAQAKDRDATLFALEQRCRWALRNHMAAPPSAAPLRQLQLLDRTLVERHGLWDGLEISTPDVRGAWALGLDIGVAHVPGPLPLARLAPDAACEVPLQQDWLTKPQHAQVHGASLDELLVGVPRRTVSPLPLPNLSVS